MESPGLPPDSPLLDDDDIPVPCKGCSNVLEEGKAFELAGNRWHIECFRCNSCNTLLDSDANLLLLGDGSLICNSCTYSCTACHNKIEDLAILTGDQAFCAGCFRCRNCKRKIENLKYARTSQGIFCMSCHESLMARRKKKSTRPPNAPSTRTPNTAAGSIMPSPMLSLDKSLPSLPPDNIPNHHSLTPTDHSTRHRPDAHRTNSNRSNPTPDQLSPMGYNADNHLRTPRSHKRHSMASQTSETSLELSQLGGAGASQDYSFIPLVLDNSPAPPSGPVPLLNTAYNPSGDRDIKSNRSSYYPQPDRQGSRDTRPSYERKTSTPSSYYESEMDRTARPHIASQDRNYNSVDTGDKPRKSHDSERARERPTINTDNITPYTQSTSLPQSARDPVSSRSQTLDTARTPVDKTEKSQGFRLGDVPKDRKKSSGTPRQSEVEEHTSSREVSSGLRSPSSATSQTTYIPGSLPRGDSFKNPNSRAESPVSLNKKPIESPINSNSSSGRSQHSHATSNSSAITSAESPPIPTETNEKTQGLQLSTKTTITNITTHESPSIGSNRPLGPAPRPPAPQPAPVTQESSFSPSISESNNSEISPALPPLRSPVGGLGFGEELERVFGGESILKRVSQTVRHGRSLSEVTRQSPKWQRPQSGSTGGGYGIPYAEITSPISPDSKDDPISLKQELRRSTQRIAELEAKLNNTVSAKALEHNIQEKRNTVALLETERETFLRELMVIKERLEASRDGQTLNMADVNSELIRGVTRELEDLKETLKSDIQTLVAQRDQLMDDVESFGRLREQAIQETEQLNMKNAQLADLNNELTRRIQGQFKTSKGVLQNIPGLGIYDGSNTDLLEIRENNEKRGPAPSITSVSTLSTPANEQPPDGAELGVAQTVAPYKKGGWIWKKPATHIMKGAGKGFNKVFAPDEGANGYDMKGNRTQKGLVPEAPGNKLFGGTQKKRTKTKTNPNGSNNQSLAEMNGHVAIFGGDLEMRVEFEGASIPNVVQKCIQEVEMRGMDLEGIYRKSGGATQMRQIQDQFERGEDVQFDPDLDICSVTSVLKQYFRNLPNPLITYEMYDRFVETSNMYEEEKRVKALKSIVDDLPASHRHVLQFLIFHLARVAARRDENLMNTRNISVVFAPTLLRHTSDEREMSDMHTKNNALQFLIDYNEAIF
ncbi:hypothetical protein EDC01DRAFT_312233 [Geopyxis carbonaria]|nr:hypothetical protein EDC01DRAFT_312233 [Geopyxis carbonaria]